MWYIAVNLACASTLRIKRPEARQSESCYEVFMPHKWCGFSYGNIPASPLYVKLPQRRTSKSNPLTISVLSGHAVASSIKETRLGEARRATAVATAVSWNCVRDAEGFVELAVGAGAEGRRK